MAKQASNGSSKEGNKARIAKCIECKGSPEKSTCTLQNMIVDYCGKCSNVIDWVKTGEPTTVKSRNKVVIDRPTGFKETAEVIIEDTPGKGRTISFSGLILPDVNPFR